MTESAGPAAEAAPNLPEYSVGELSFALKRVVEDRFGFVRVRGELSGVKPAGSGHLYFALKDDKAVLDGVCWRAAARALRFRPEDGLEVVCTGRLSTYPGRSKYQLIVERMEPAGVGALMALLEERRRRLQAEGLFAAERRRPLPFLPQVIGVVTSPTGAVIRDILHRLRERFPRHVLVWPVLVQGEGAAGQVARAIEGFNRIDGSAGVPRPDVLIVARGGGSIEDLWAFNEEEVVRAAAASAIPLISAVGHETDTTLIDFVADRRAPTPTAAAEIAVPVRRELLERLADLGGRQDGCMERRLVERARALDGLARGLRRPQDLLNMAVQRLDDAADRLERGLVRLVERRRGELAGLAARLRPEALARDIARHGRELGRCAERLEGAARRRVGEADQRFRALGKLLESYSYRDVLRRGFVLVRGPDRQALTGAAAVSPGLELILEFRDGEVRAVAQGGAADRSPGRGGRGRPSAGGQGSLFE